MARPSMEGRGVTNAHKCRQTEDPRRPGKCACGEPLRTPTTILRDTDLEAFAIDHACRGIVDPQDLIEHCCRRAGGTLSGEYVTDPLLVRADANWMLELRAEIADGVNYTVWKKQRLVAYEDLQASQAVLDGIIGHLARAYELSKQIS